MSEQALSRIAYAATNTPPVCAGTTYTQSYLSNVNTITPTFVTGAIGNVAAGDLFVDLITGATGYIATVGASTVTINSGSDLATPFAGGRAWEIHKSPLNLLTGTTQARPIMVNDPQSIEWSYRLFSGTSSALRPFICNPGSGMWSGQGSGILTPTNGDNNVTDIVSGSFRRAAVMGTTFSYTSNTGVLTATFNTGFGYWDVYGGCMLIAANGSQQKQIQAVDPTNSKIYLMNGLTLTAGNFTVAPAFSNPYLYWYVSTATGSPVVRVSNRVVSRP